MSRDLGRTPSAYEKLAERYDWHARAAEYDRQVQDADAEVFEQQRQEASKQRMARELQRQSDSWALAQDLARITRELAALPYTEIREKHTPDGKIDRAVLPINTKHLAGLAMLTREVNRLLQSSITDMVEDQRHRWESDEKDPLKGAKRLAGTFTIGDVMWGDQQPPEIPKEATGTVRVLPPIQEIQSAPEPPLIDLTGTEGLYSRPLEDES